MIIVNNFYAMLLVFFFTETLENKSYIIYSLITMQVWILN